MPTSNSATLMHHSRSVPKINADNGIASNCGTRCVAQTLIEKGRRNGLDMIIGDFNRAYADLDRDPRSVDRSVDPDWPIQLIASGYVDAWRVTHPGVREYSWFSPRANSGFRIDDAYATPAVADSVIACEFDRTPLEQRETDHCALTLSLSST